MKVKNMYLWPYKDTQTMNKGPILLSTEYTEGLPGLPLLTFSLPSTLEAGEPPEARGLARDEVRLLVSYRSDNRIVHARFRQLEDFLVAGDLLVINTSGTMNAALHARRKDGTKLELHLSTHIPADQWIVEVRTQREKATRPFYDIHEGETLYLADEATITLHMPYLEKRDMKPTGKHRLWIATLALPSELQVYLTQYGFPIRYGYVQEQWPLDYYQTVYVTEVGSAEMPSAGRAFTPELITRLIAKGVEIAPLILHTGVASLEAHEPPYEEYYRVSPETARRVNTAHVEGKRVIAVGTTVVRALETVTDNAGITYPGEGLTRLVVTPERGLHAVNALLTGLHEPYATHLFMLEALASAYHLKLAYDEALREQYLWHEFGDVHLILP